MNTMLKILVLSLMTLGSVAVHADEWPAITKKARGQTIYFNAWGGSSRVNNYIRWAATEVKQKYGVVVKHVKITDIGDVVNRLLAEKSAHRTSGGSVDLMWINGENFKAMKKNQLLSGPFTEKLPNYRFVDTENKPTVLFDFTTPVDHMEAPWGMAQLVFMVDTARVTWHPSGMKQLLKFAKEHPGRVTYPAPPSFHGTTFIKQALLELATDRTPLYQAVALADFNRVTAPLWEFLDELRPYMWRKGKTFTHGAPEMKQLLNDGEIFISLSFNPNDASNAIANGELPDTVRTYVHESGTIGNTHFVGIPFNSNAKEGAMVFANYLMSPMAQLHKAKPSIWGDPTVLAVDKLNAKDRIMFNKLPLGIAPLSPAALGKVLLEPDSSWVDALEKAWLRRYHK